MRDLTHKLEKQATELGLTTKLDNGFCVFYKGGLTECFLTVDELKSYLRGFKAAQIFAAMGV